LASFDIRQISCT